MGNLSPGTRVIIDLRFSTKERDLLFLRVVESVTGEFYRESGVIEDPNRVVCDLVLVGN